MLQKISSVTFSTNEVFCIVRCAADAFRLSLPAERSCRRRRRCQLAGTGRRRASVCRICPGSRRGGHLTLHRIRRIESCKRAAQDIRLERGGTARTRCRVAEQNLRSSKYEILGGPRDLLGNGTAVALQVCGPSGEVFYLTTIRGERMQNTYGAAECDVGRVFIAVLGASNIRNTLRYYQPHSAGVSRPRPFSIRVLSAAHNLDSETKFRIAAANLQRQYRIEVDEYPASAKPRPLADGELPPGMCIVSCTADVTDETLLIGPDGERLQIQPA